MHSILSKINSSGKKAYLFGDINIDILKIESHKQSCDYVNSLFSLGFLQLITVPTRCIHNSSTLIDHILTNDIQPSYECGALTNRISDHFPIFYILNTSKPKIAQKSIRTRHINSENTQKFKQLLNNVHWPDTLDSDDPQVSLDCFLKTFLELYNSYFPEKTTRFNRNFNRKEKWLTTGLLTSRRTKISLCTLSIKEPSVINIQNFKSFRNLYNKLIRVAKKQYFDDELVKQQKNLKETWKILKEAIKSNTNRSNTVDFLKVNGIGTSDHGKIAESFNEHFSTMAEQVASKIPPTSLSPDHYCKTVECSFKSAHIPISLSELLDTTKTLQSKVSSDMNGLSSSFLKEIISSITSPLLHIFNLTLSKGIVPMQLKIAKVVPIFKNGDPENVDNYRPISLLCTLSKILEKIMAVRLTDYFEANCIINNFQFGFRKNHNTAHPMVLLLNKISKALNSKEYALTIFCDLQKAFDTCDHEILLKKLNKTGVKGLELNWFSSYLSNRQQFVQICEKRSGLRNVSCGVPQGSILGPLLFLVYINDLPNVSKLFALLFADDTTLFTSHKNLKDLINFANTEFKKICEYFRANKMALHPKKTQFLIFSNKKIDEPIQIFLDNNNFDALVDDSLRTPIHFVTTDSEVPAVKFLGVYFDPKLNFKYHLQTVKNKISRALFALRQVKNFLNQKALLSLYTATIHSHLTYGIQIWGCANKATLNEIFKKQKQAIRIVNNSNYNAHTEPLFKQCKVLPLPVLIKYFNLQFIHSYKFNLLPTCFNNTWMSNRSLREELMPNTLAEDIREHRLDENFHLPEARTSQVENFPLTNLPKTWNTLPCEILKTISKKNIFSSRLKLYFIDQLSINPNCNRENCPNC